MKITTNLICALVLSTASGVATAECFGSGEYRVCSESYTDADGNIQVRSWDSDGNDYSVNTESYVDGDGMAIRSYDSDGNEYSVHAWTDSTGSHSEDSDGNRCTITRSGEMIGCD